MITYLSLVLAVVATKTTTAAEFLQDLSFKAYVADISPEAEVSMKWEKLPMEFASIKTMPPKKGYIATGKFSPDAFYSLAPG
mgnify:CR=1 FL=1